MRFVDIRPEELECERRFGSALMKMLTLMEWPEDPAARGRLAALTAEPALERRILDLGDAPFNDRAFLTLRGPPGDPYALMKDKLRPTVKETLKHKKHVADGFRKPAIEMPEAMISGAILLKAFDIQAEGQPVTVGKSTSRVSKYLGNSGSASCRPQDLAAHWKPYRHVAHFHAAELQMLIAGMRKDADPTVFGHFLYLAESFRRRGEAIKIRNVGTLLDPLMSWKVPLPVMHTIIRQHSAFHVRP